MRLIGKLGGLLRVLSVVWCVSSLVRVFIAMANGNGLALAIHLALLVLGATVFAAGTVLRNRWGEHSIGIAITQAKASWWRTALSFRLSIFLCIGWLVTSYLWQDAYGRDYSLVLGPPIGALAFYLVFRLLVVGPPKPDNTLEATMPKPKGPEGSVSAELVGDESNTPQSRERMMRELTLRMAKKE